MRKEEIEAKFIDLVENTLDEEEAKELRQMIAADAELSKSFEDYQNIVAIEKELSSAEHSLHENFVVKVMNQLEETGSDGFFRSIKMMFSKYEKIVFSSVATCAVLVLVVKLAYDTPSYLIDKDARVKEVPPVVVDLSKSNKDSSSGPVLATEYGKQSEVVGQERKSRQLKMDTDDSKTITIDAPVGIIKPGEDLGSKSESEGVTTLDSSVRNYREEIAQSVRDSSTKGGPLKGKSLSRVDELGSSGSRIAVPRHKRVTSVENYSKADIAVPSDVYDYKRHAPGVSNQAYRLHPSQDRERYGSWTENTRKLVADEPVSTFSIDVDTGSYTNARRFLQAGQLPPKNSVRIEEFINYFKYNYPVQHSKPFTLSYEIAPSPLESDRYLLKLGIKAKDASSSEKPWNLVFLVDVSGSMSTPDKLGLVQRSLKLLVKRMRPGDKVSIVTYAGYAGVALDATGIDEKHKILRAIDSLHSGGSTHGSAGIHKAYDIAQRHLIKGGVNRVVLATDGDFNVGVTNSNELIKLIERKRNSGITLTTLGFGTGNINESMMEQLANKGNGNYFYIDSFKEARKVFSTDLAGTMEVVAKDVKLQIEFNTANVAQYRLIGYENRKLRKQDFNNDLIDAGEIGSGHTVTAMYEIVLADSALAKSLDSEYRYKRPLREKKMEAIEDFNNELAFLKIRYKKPEGHKSTLIKFPIERKYLNESAKKASDDFRFAAAVSYAAHLLRGSQYVGAYTFEDIVKLASEAKGEDKHGYRREFVELMKNAAAVRD